MSVKTKPDSKRPLMVWFIVLFYLYGLIAGFGVDLLISSGVIQLPAEEAATLETLKASQTTLDIVWLWLSNGFVVVKIIALFLLRKIALPIFAVHEILGISYVIWWHSHNGFAEIFGMSLIGEVISLLILLYVWNLHRSGVLR